MELKIGQKVYLKPIENAARYGDRKIRESAIVKIGRKYFYVGNPNQPEWTWVKFSRESFKEVSK